MVMKVVKYVSHCTIFHLWLVWTDDDVKVSSNSLSESAALYFPINLEGVFDHDKYLLT